jgi:hypothetical protein
MNEDTLVILESAYPECPYSMRDLDDETIQILVDDKIATGG